MKRNLRKTYWVNRPAARVSRRLSCNEPTGCRRWVCSLPCTLCWGWHLCWTGPFRSCRALRPGRSCACRSTGMAGRYLSILPRNNRIEIVTSLMIEQGTIWRHRESRRSRRRCRALSVYAASFCCRPFYRRGRRWVLPVPVWWIAPIVLANVVRRRNEAIAWGSTCRPRKWRRAARRRPAWTRDRIRTWSADYWWLSWRTAGNRSSPCCPSTWLCRWRCNPETGSKLFPGRKKKEIKKEMSDTKI